MLPSVIMRFARLFRTSLILVLATILFVSSIAYAGDDDFFDVVISNFDRWDTNHDGRLTVQDVDRAILDSSNKGDAACALSVLHINLKHASDSQKAGYTKAWLMRSANSKAGSRYQSKFSRAEQKLSKSVPYLFTDRVPHLNSIRQGKIGDCYLIATIGSLVNSRPQVIRRLIVSNPNGSYSVSFAGQPPIAVARPSDGELATYGQSIDGGIWLNVIEKAYATLKFESNPAEDEDAMYQGICGGRSGGIIKLLTGHTSRRISFKKVHSGKKLREALRAALSQNRIVTTSITTTTADGARRGHVLAVLDYNPSNDSVTLWNPWGTTAKYKAVGLMMRNGTFTMPLNDWDNTFTGVVIENGSAEG